MAKTDLEDEKSTAGALEYTADKIQKLEGVEAVRKRPAMYIGDTGERCTTGSPHLAPNY